LAKTYFKTSHFVYILSWTLRSSIAWRFGVGGMKREEKRQNIGRNSEVLEVKILK
jgi:hypothetical protein